MCIKYEWKSAYTLNDEKDMRNTADGFQSSFR